ncbi:MAG: ABC transporter ATP-binding protein/permease [Arcobacteraceae bacterium]|nr:ABC transporter ATP-binding protein/permease [Arcobacteraceae bacterium]
MNTKKTAKQGLWAILAPVNFEIYTAMFLSAISAISLIASLTLLSFTLSNILLGTPLQIFDIEFDIFITIIVLAIITTISFLSRSSAFVVSHLGAFRLEQILRTNLSLHLSKVPLGYIISTGSGALKKVLKDDVLALHVFVADSTPMIAKSILAPILTMIILFIVDYRLALASVFVLVVGAIVMSYAMKDSVEYRVKYENSQTDINKAVVEFAQAMPVVRTFDDGSESFKKYNDSLFSYRKNLDAWMSQTSTSAKLGTLILTPLPTLLAILLTGMYFLNNGSLELSSLILALFLSTGMADSLMPLMWLNNFIKKSQAAALRIQEIMDIEDLPQASVCEIPNDISISFKNVSFAYNKTDKKALDDISFVVSAKSTTALVGPSGAGKSTVAKLIPRFWDVTSGSIKIGDTDIRDISNEKLMDIVSFVFQDTFLFADTIFNNIKMANPNATKEDVINAAKAAQIHDFIESLPNAYETKAGERGANLSGGQKQRITIARTILRDNPIIVLDEATAFADPENEEEIIKALANLMKNKTVIVIAHRLSTIKDVDQIIVVDEGKIKERGKHQELLDNKQVYFDLWSNYEKAQAWNLETKEAV